MEPPRDEADLRSRLRRLAGSTLGEIAAAHGVQVPSGTNKGWAGVLLEKALGATGSSRAEPDFPLLGIELKTIPIDGQGRPLESCFVASLELGSFDRRWETSAVRKKLERVAWVAVQASPAIPLAARRCGASLLWSPSAEEQQTLRADYEEIVELVGEGMSVTGHRGKWLQLRPKGRNARDLRWSLDEEGARTRTAPRAFYLRPSFTASLLERHFVLPAP